MLRAAGRWNRSGSYGALYLAMTDQGALAERANAQTAAAASGLPFGPHDLASLAVGLRRALDFIDRAVCRRFGVRPTDLVGHSSAAYARCWDVADLARAQGEFVLLVPSAALPDATNLIVYPEVPPGACSLDVGPDRIPLD